MGPPGEFATQSADPAIAARRKIRTADTDKATVKKCGREILQPIWVRIGVVVDIGHDFARRCEEPRIASVAEA